MAASALVAAACCLDCVALHCFALGWQKQSKWRCTAGGVVSLVFPPAVQAPSCRHLWQQPASASVSSSESMPLPDDSSSPLSQLCFPPLPVSVDTCSDAAENPSSSPPQFFSASQLTHLRSSVVGRHIARGVAVLLVSCAFASCCRCCLHLSPARLTCSAASVCAPALWNGLGVNVAKKGVAWTEMPLNQVADGRASTLLDLPRRRPASSALFVHGRMEAAAAVPAYSMFLVGDPVAGSMVQNKVSVYVSADDSPAVAKSDQLAACVQEMRSAHEDQAYAHWLAGVKDEAVSSGVSREIVDIALEGVLPSDKILALKNNQPEVKLSAKDYLARMVDEYRVSKGVTSLKQHEQLLADVSAKYGVPSPVLVAIWGVESSYGGFPGSWDVVEALVTMAYKGETDSGRASYFRRELIEALRIMNQGHGPPGGKRLLGSWAGAMGQCQFMPSSFQKFAVDYDEDGKKDIWESRADVFASMANFLRQHGWKQGAPIAHRVRVPRRLDRSLLGLHVRKPVREWQNKYKVWSSGEQQPAALGPDDMVSLVAPDGHTGVAYLVFDNFRTIMRYNPSTLYSLAILQLSQLIEERSGGGRRR